MTSELIVNWVFLYFKIVTFPSHIEQLYTIWVDQQYTGMARLSPYPLLSLFHFHPLLIHTPSLLSPSHPSTPSLSPHQSPLYYAYIHPLSPPATLPPTSHPPTTHTHPPLLLHTLIPPDPPAPHTSPPLPIFPPHALILGGECGLSVDHPDSDRLLIHGLLLVPALPRGWNGCNWVWGRAGYCESTGLL